MSIPLKIGIIGDFDPHRSSQVMIQASLKHGAYSLGARVELTWLSTRELNDGESFGVLNVLDAVWAGPGEYMCPDAAMEAIQFCREKEKPFFGT